MNDEASFLNELKRHCGQMAPHQKDRHAGRLLLRSITAVEELVELKTRLIQSNEGSTATAYRDAETIRKLRDAFAPWERKTPSNDGHSECKWCMGSGRMIEPYYRQEVLCFNCKGTGRGITP